MGEVLVTSGGKMGFEVEEAEMMQPAVKNDDGRITSAGADSHVGWERFLPKMVVRVLLVEADDSTRQIISALLRKCSYRVSAVSDGLKAWELLKGRPHSIDLILTEVELPSISGYALLTLIMEHEVCKNIPVIMMSSHDSVSTVYKCMLRGATDFLVKPVRKNELRNLWQHVWRKLACQSNSGSGLGSPYENIAQEKDEATAENNDISNHSSGHMSSIQRNKECIEKGSDAQSSCTKPVLEAKRDDQEHVQCLLLPKSSKCLSDEIRITSNEEFPQESRKRQVRDDENGELQPVQKMFASFTTKQAAENAQEPVQIASESNHVLEDSSGGAGAIDLIGAFANHQNGSFGSSDPKRATKEYEVMPQLDLSLRRNNPSVSANRVNDERHRLNHSDASPFSRYINKSLQLHNSSMPGTCNQKKDHENNSEQQLLNNYTEAHGSTTSPKQVPVIQKGENENRFSYSQNREVSHPIPGRGVRLENLVNACSSAMPSAYLVQPSHRSLPSPGAAHHSESFPQMNTLYTSECQPSTSQQVQCPIDHQRISNSIEWTDSEQGKKLENLEDQGHASPANDQSTTNSSFCNGNISHIQSAGSGSYGNISAISISKTPSECGNEESFHVYEGSSHRSIQREAALTKFRLKRKDRCFEKKVRYESRKKLAEQRPRVKGQFVRQVSDDPQPRSSPAG